jgi:uncharacterized protein YgiM (DUF1202 family)
MIKFLKKYWIECIGVIALLVYGICLIIAYNNNKPRTLIVNTHFIRVRECASVSCNWLDTVNRGDTFTILEEVTATPTYDWYKIEYTKGKYGYIASAKNEPYVLIHR